MSTLPHDVIMDLTIRKPSSPDEYEQSRRLAGEAFGMPAQPPSEPAGPDGPGATTFAAFDGSIMAARMIERDYQSWFGGRLVPTSGIGGVTVAVEYRGRKLLAGLFTELYAAARERGAVISTLYPSAPAIYRRLGYEVIGTAEPVRVPISALARIRRPEAVITRRATAADVPAIRRLYDGWAAAHNGPLSRRGPSFPTTDEELITAFTGITVAVRDTGNSAPASGEVIGYASWQRGSDWGADAVIKISDLIATAADGYRALLADFGTFAGLLGQLSLDTSGLDVVRYLLPSSDWRPGNCDPYMLKIIDVPGAMRARGFPQGFSLSLEFGLSGDPITGIDGHYRLDLADGSADCRRLADLGPGPEAQGRLELPIFTPNGLALAYAGAQSPAAIRTVGGLWGPDGDDDAWGAIFAGRPVRIRDHF
ncbi:GNAT family N-acetyltransferase [Microlunatus elymi]|uniref:GNAT family N-acetyltransferase n=1 Tax=Microlunatus elymi TaxID=2596828 RepID=A0A516Q353_9ACTN|nr:GNAT family N-acetyltransferase [Microlunatus elymi]QDP97857.1 GNAT family N-acetyltransferase [Microlunatus elymi]